VGISTGTSAVFDAHRRTNVFVEGGFAARRSYRTDNKSFSSSANSGLTYFPKDTKYIRRGFVAAAGMDIPLAPFHILPEMRYTRWLTPEKYYFAEGEGSSSNSIEILLGFSFGANKRYKK
jgi:hypothetical protein